MVFHFLYNKFSFFNYDFTKLLEDELDQIATGERDYTSTIQRANEQLQAEIKQFLLSN